MRTLWLANNLTFVFGALLMCFGCFFHITPTENQKANKKLFLDTSGAVNTFFVETLALFRNFLCESGFCWTVHTYTYMHTHIHAQIYWNCWSFTFTKSPRSFCPIIDLVMTFALLRWQKICWNIIVSIISKYLAYFDEIVVNFCHFCTAKFIILLVNSLPSVYESVWKLFTKLNIFFMPKSAPSSSHGSHETYWNASWTLIFFIFQVRVCYAKTIIIFGVLLLCSLLAFTHWFPLFFSQFFDIFQPTDENF